MNSKDSLKMKLTNN